MDNATARLSHLVATARIEDIPASTLEQVRRTLLNIIGCAVGGSQHDSVTSVLAALSPFGGAPVATVLGRGQRADPMLAALANGMAASVYSFDDTHAEAVVHPGGPVAMALLALAETRRVSGADFLLAVTLGCEVVCRVSKAVSVTPAKAGTGWVQTGIAAGLGAAAGAARLMRLDASQTTTAMGIAACQSGGVRALTRSHCYALMCGNAAEAGLRAALLAAGGVTSTADGLEAAGGWAQAYAASPNLAALDDGLGQRFEIEANTFKPYPCGVVIHPVIDACLELLPEVKTAGGTSAIEHIGLRVNPAVLSLTNIQHPRDPSEAQVSVQHWTAATLVDGKAGTEQSRPGRMADPVIGGLRDRIVLEPEPGIARDAATVTLKLGSGASLSRSIANCRGSAERPMSNADLEAKMRDQCAGTLAPAAIEAIIAACWALEHETDASAIARLAAGPATSERNGGVA